MNIFEQWGLRQVINASGKMTALGSTAVTPAVAEALAQGAASYVVMDELLLKASDLIAAATGAEAGVPTLGAAAGLAISVAATVAGTDLGKIEALPASEGKNEIILPKGHSIHFGASVEQMIRLGGGRPVEAGHANLVTAAHVESAINERTAALLYVKSHHTMQKGMVSLSDLIALGHKYRLPVIVDAAAEEDLTRYIHLGADLVIYSGGKAIGGPTSGFICGKASLIEACRLQYQGIGRAMKVSKEAIAGLLTALAHYQQQQDRDPGRQRMEQFVEKLNQLPHVRARLIKDEAGRDIYRASLELLPEAGLSAKELVAALEGGNPAIYTRNHQLNLGIINFDPRPLLPGQEQLILDRLRTILKGAADR